MSKKTKEEAEKTRRRILASALALFSSRGYDRTTFNDIAARLKLTKGAIYWHFESKESVLIELVRLALEKFRRQIESVMPEGELSFPLVAEMMVKNAAIVVGDPKAAAFFRLMKCQICWEKKSMSEVRADLLNNAAFGPKEAFREAIANDVRRGRVREGVDAEQISTVAVALIRCPTQNTPKDGCIFDRDQYQNSTAPTEIPSLSAICARSSNSGLTRSTPKPWERLARTGP